MLCDLQHKPLAKFLIFYPLIFVLHSAGRILITGHFSEHVLVPGIVLSFSWKETRSTDTEAQRG